MIETNRVIVENSQSRAINAMRLEDDLICNCPMRKFINNFVCSIKSGIGDQALCSITTKIQLSNMLNRMKTKNLKPLKGTEVVKTGKYICLPCVAFRDDNSPVWIVEVQKSKTLLCYRPFGKGEELKVVSGCGHIFYKI